MLRFMGAGMILAACVLTGNWAAERLRRKVRLLRGVQQGLLVLQQEMEYVATPMERAFSVAGEAAGCSGSVFYRTAELLRRNRSLTAGESWLASLRQEPLLYRCAGETLELIASGLGLSDRKGQARSLELCRARLYSLEQAAIEEESRWGRLWRALGWSTGALLILVVL